MSEPPQLHPLLLRQFTEISGAGGALDIDQWHALLRAISDTYSSAANQLAFQQHRLNAVLDVVSAAVLVVDESGVVSAVNAEAVRLLGPQTELVGARIDTLLMAGPTDQSATRVLGDDWQDTVMYQQRWTLDDVILRPKDRPAFTADCEIVPYRAVIVDGEQTHPWRTAVLTITDATDRDGLRAEMQWQATHDPLTGLGNRAMVTDRLDHALALASRSGSWPAVLFIDLDRFKSVNDQLGGATGDRLLVEAGRRIAREVRSVDTVARLSGDKFVVLCEALETADIAEQVAARVLQSMDEPFDFNGELVTISTSIGLARVDRPSDTADEIIERANVAMYRAKENGRNRIETYDSIMRTATPRRVDMERALRMALDNDDLTVVYQPIFNTEPGSLVAFEALVRWEHEQFGKVSPVEFIPLAEETGLIAALGERVLDIACRDAASWRETARFTIGLHVNVSGRQLSASNFVSYLSRVLRHHHMEPSTLTLELTESVLLDNPERAAARLMALRDLGVRIAIDDFGVGYSSLAYLRRFPLDVLKVDRQFVAGIAQSPEGQTILQEIVDMAAGLDYVVIAEGVEQPEELVSLRELGFQFAQGYLLAAPMPPAEALLLAAASPIPEQMIVEPRSR